MQKSFLSKLGVRFTYVKTNPGHPYNWLFLPGGPGLGSEYFFELTPLLQVPGSIWHIDLPGDGSNRGHGIIDPFGTWFGSILDACSQMSDSILAAHSTGGMFALSTLGLEAQLAGLVLMNSAPDSSWKRSFDQFVRKNPIEGLSLLYQKYQVAPSDGLLKIMTLKAKQYSFTPAGLNLDLAWMERLPYNFAACDWAEQHFDSTYLAKWMPQNIPTLIFSGEEDKILPLELFSKKAEYRRANIHLVKIPNAAHYPWIENLEAVCQSFLNFSNTLRKS